MKFFSDFFNEELTSNRGNSFLNTFDLTEELTRPYCLTEAGQKKGKFVLAQTPVEKFRAYLEELVNKKGKFVLDDEVPDFDKNYNSAKSDAMKYGKTNRVDMPVIDGKSQVLQFQQRLASGTVDNTKPFAPETDPRDPFPQGLKGDTAKKWLDAGLRDGAKPDDVIKVSKVSIPASKLKPAQVEIYPDKAMEWFPDGGEKGTRKFLAGDSLIIISKDNYILDGHHRWLQARIVDPSIKMTGVQVDRNMKDLLPLGLAYGDAIGNKRNA